MINLYVDYKKNYKKKKLNNIKQKPAVAVASTNIFLI